MRRCVLRCLVPAFLAVLSAVPAAASPIKVGSFYFFGDEFFEYFVLDNNADGPLATLTFSGLIQIDGSDYADQFDPGPIASGGSVFSSGLFPIAPFTGGGKASLVFTSNAASFGGSLGLSNLLFDDLDLTDGYSPSFTAAVQFIEDAPATVAETPSWIVVAIGLSALAIGRAIFS